MMQLTASGLACERGGRLVFSGLAFSLGPGESMLVSGPNGAGKTTLLRTICGLCEPNAGRIDLTGLDRELTIGQRSHYIAHSDGVKAALTVAENLAFWADFYGGADIEAALHAFDLEPLAHYSAALLSSGQRRRLALSRLLLVRRLLWILDEPTVGLDAASQKMLTSHAEDHLAQGGMAIVTSHIPLDLSIHLQLDMTNFMESA
jgi:heme exporter protein A